MDFNSSRQGSISISRGASFSSQATNKKAELEPVASGGLELRYQHDEETELYAMKFSNESEYLTVGRGDGHIKTYQAKTGLLVNTLVNDSALPCTSMCYRPSDSQASRIKNVLIATYADGSIRHWHVTSGKLLSKIENPDNQLFTCDYSHDGSTFVTAGKDYHLRLYDESTQKEVMALFTGRGDATAGHSNRIFCAKFNPTDPNLLLSGGWDNTVQLWDTRVNYSVRSLYGPHICGESIDYSDDGTKIVTGSYVKDEALQIWDMDSCEVIETMRWTNTDEAKPMMLYAAGYSHGSGQNKYIMAGGGGGLYNEAKIYNMSAKKNQQCFGVVQNLPGAIYAMCMSKNDQYMAMGGGSKCLYVYDVQPVINDQGFSY